MSWEYFNEDRFGLKRVGQVDWTDDAYSWHTTSVFFDPTTKTFYWETGGGCSCDGPLEFVQGLDDLDHGNAFKISKELMDLAQSLQDDKYETTEFKVQQGLRATRLIETIFEFNDNPDKEAVKNDD